MFETLVPIYIAGVALVIAAGVGAFVWRAHKQAELRRRVTSSEPIAAADFLRDWRIGKRGSGLGYSSMDRPGCYVILTNPRGQGADVVYDAVYVGQSVKVCSRVRQHLTGHGNGDVYADVREGKDVQVRIMPCEKAAMNATEKELIAAFRATDSYNRTQGGAKRR